MAKRPKRGNGSTGEADTPSTVYEPTAREAEALANHRARRRSRPPLPEMKFERGSFSVDHEDAATGCNLLTAASGFTGSAAFARTLHLLAQVCDPNEKTLEGQLNGMLAVAAGIEPRDDVEAMLAAQMAATHELTLAMAKRLAKAENIPQQDSAERAFNKLARTYAAQAEALRRHRQGGQQKITVERVTVNEGGQAIVGNVGTGDGRKT